MEQEKNKKFRKITGGISAGIILAATLVGAGFGYSKNVENINGLDPKYDDVLRVQADVQLSKGGTLEGAADSIQDTLDFLGRQDTYIRTMGDDRLVIDIPINAYYDVDGEESNLEMMNDTSNNTYYKTQAENLIIALLFNGTLDFRGIDGSEAFLLDDYNTWYFNESAMTASIDTGTGSESGTSKDIDWEVDAKDFYEEATLTHYNGAPVIQIQLSEKGNDSNEYINAFKDFNQWIKSNQSTGVTYVAWFNYELVADILEELGLGTNPYEYIVSSGNQSLRPLYLTASNQELMTSKFDDKIEITGNFTESQAKYFVNKLNSSIYYSYSNIETSLIVNAKSKIALTVIGILFIVFIIVVIFLMVAYFGLLGLISASVFTLTNLAFAAVFVSSGMLITGLGIMSLIVVAAISAFITYFITNTYISNNNDKYISSTNIAGKKFMKLNSILLTPIISAVIIFYLSGLLLTTMIAVPLYLVVIGLVLSYAFGILLLFPIIYIFDLVTQFTKDEIEGKYDLLTGINWSADFSLGAESTNTKKKSYTVMIIAAVALILSGIVGGTLFFTTGSPVNTNFYNNESYIYKVMPTEGVEVYLDTTPPSVTASTVTADFSSDIFEITNDTTSEVKKAFKDAGVKVYDVSVIRNDKLFINDTVSDDETIDAQTYMVSEFGMQVYSKTELDASKIDSINTNLSTIETTFDIESTIGSDAAITSWELVEGYSWTGTESLRAFNYTENFMFKQVVFTLIVVVLVTALILLFVGNWGVSLASIATSILEMILAFSPIIILFLPYNYLVAFPLILMAVISSVAKIIITKKAKTDEINDGKWQRAAKDQSLLGPILAGVMLVVEILLIGIYGWIVILPMIVITALYAIAIYFIQQFVFTNLGEVLGGYRDKVKENKLNEDIRRSKDKDELSEEFIEGVNM